ncbi:DUF3313 family protein [Pseudomonas sp. L-22-4S-12]|uniref:DUF3313 domain-containing protein n=1 Tax=Pseudomonas sp. L-22-4S-12 TaxID=2610893 RepID=UPI001328761C|nr:DUF3313 domain-containing protein [Pseudomonas sp. L-22-4S-12]MWV16384.1 DUF3313 family protein [Pseudomonas sp. L-22-4S-12]
MTKCFAASLLATCMLVSGCTSTLVQPDQYSGFLQDYSRLSEQQSPSGVKVARWVDPNLDINRYTQVYIEPSKFYPTPQPDSRISQTTLQGITDYYDQALKRELSKVIRVSNSPSGDTLVIRPAITAVSAETEGLKPYEVIPIALVVAAATTAAGERDQQVEIATEASLVDAKSGKVVAEVVRKGAGTDLENKKQVLSADDVKPVIDGWANDMRLSVEQLRAKR